LFVLQIYNFLSIRTTPKTKNPTSFGDGTKIFYIIIYYTISL
jgi:hypothetical protein